MFGGHSLDNSCGLSTASKDYSCPAVFVCGHITPNNESVNLKLEHIVVYENRPEKFDIGHCPIKVKIKAQLNFFSIYHNRNC